VAEKSNKTYKLSLAVGSKAVDAALASQLSELVNAGQLQTGSKIKVDCVCVLFVRKA
jgi:hypothetical protein